MRVISRKCFPVSLCVAGHYSVPLDGGLLVNLDWQYGWSAGTGRIIDRAAAMKMRRAGCKPYKLYSDSPREPERWEIATVGEKWSWATIKVYHYGSRINYYAGGTLASEGTELLSDLEAKGGWELSIGRQAIRLEPGPLITRRIRFHAFGECRHPKHMLVRLLG